MGVFALLLAAGSLAPPNPLAASAPEPPAACAPAALAADLGSCDASIAAERDPHVKAQLLLRRAYAFNEKYEYDAALKDLDAALALDPDLPQALHERGYTLGELGDYGRALKDLDRDVASRPDNAESYQERAYARHWSGDFAGAWADRDREVALRPNDPGPLLGRADEALWLGRFEDARRDVNAAEALAPTANDENAAPAARQASQRIALMSATGSGGSAAERCNAADKEGKFDRPNLIGDCTAAFFMEHDSKARAGFLIIRAIAWLVGQQDLAASTIDDRIAVALDPGNPTWHMNLGFAYVQAHHSWAGEREFTKSLELHESWAALAGRAHARYNLGRKDEALADAKKSYALHPNDLALTVLGDLAHDGKDDKAARQFWLGAYRMGDRDDGLIAELKSIGVDHPEQERP